MSIRTNSWLGEDGIIYHDLSGMVNLTKDIIEDLRVRREELIPNTDSHYVITLLDGVLSVDFEAQEYLSHHLFTKKIRASAFVGSGFLFEHMTSMFFWYHHPSYQVERFYSLEKAQTWMQNQKKLIHCA